MASRRVRYEGRRITSNQRQVLGTGWKGAKTTVTTVTTVRTSNTQSGETASESAATNRMSREEMQQHIPEPLPEVPGIDFKQFDDVCDLADDMLREEDNPPAPVPETTSYRRRRAVGPPLGGLHAYITSKDGGTVTRVVRRHVFMTRT